VQLTLTGATIVDTRDGTSSPDMTLVIEDQKIARIGPAVNAAASATGTTIDARGLFVVPGFLDLHAHPLNSSDPHGSLTLMLANGITGFRQMSGTPETLAARRAGTLMPATPAPELLEMPGQILTGANAGSPERAFAEVRAQHAQGADFIKVIDVGPEVFFAALAESTRLGLRFLGHLPPAVNVAAAARAGMRSIEHLGPRDSILLGCSSAEDELRGLVAQQAPKTSAISGPIPAGVIQRALANPMLLTAPAEVQRYVRVVETFSAAEFARLAAQFVASGTWQVPTLIRVRTQTYGDDRAYRDDPNLRYVPPAQKQMWEELAQQFATKFAPDARRALEGLFAQQTRLVRPLKDAGVKMMTGSDSGGSAGWTIPGFSLHQEFDLLAEAGLTPLEILQMTTLNGAEYLGREATMGRIAEGGDANLVVLAANPIASAQHLHRIAGVVRAGTYYPAAALEALKESVAAHVATLPPPCAPAGPSCC
jgi:imidazolonepropionase-like amidohydrolase